MTKPMLTTFSCGCTYDEDIRMTVKKCTDDPNRPQVGENGRLPCVLDKWTRDGSEVGRAPTRTCEGFVCGWCQALPGAEHSLVCKSGQVINERQEFQVRV